MGLKDWLASGWLIEHEPSAEEIAALFAVAARDLSDSGLAGLVSDSEAKGMVELAERLRDDVTNWLKAEHQELAP